MATEEAPLIQQLNNNSEIISSTEDFQKAFGLMKIIHPILSERKKMTTEVPFIQQLNDNYKISSVEAQQRAVEYVKKGLFEASLKGKRRMAIHRGQCDDLDEHYEVVCDMLLNENIAIDEQPRGMNIYVFSFKVV